MFERKTIAIKLLDDSWVVAAFDFPMNVIPLNLYSYFPSGEKYKFKGPSKSGRLMYREII